MLRSGHWGELPKGTKLIRGLEAQDDRGRSLLTCSGQWPPPPRPSWLTSAKATGSTGSGAKRHRHPAQPIPPEAVAASSRTSGRHSPLVWTKPGEEVRALALFLAWLASPRPWP